MVKWTEEKTADGWYKVTNEGGKTLGYFLGGHLGRQVLGTGLGVVAPVLIAVQHAVPA